MAGNTIDLLETSDNFSGIVTGNGSFLTTVNETGELLSSSSDAELVLQILAIVVCSSISLTTVISNLLVIISVAFFHELKRPSNYFLVSMAVADLLVGLTAMPFKLVDDFLHVWYFGPWICKVFNANDVLFTTASTIHLCCISMDRYVAIIYPLQYRQVVSTKRVRAILAGAWLLSLGLAYGPIFSDIYATPEQILERDLHPELCPFQVAPWYAAVSSTITFWIPLFIMIVAYQKIFREANRQEGKLYRMRKGYISSIQNSEYRSDQPAQETAANNTRTSKTSQKADGEATHTLQNHPRKKQVNVYRREYKAAKTLGVVMGLFILCFMPFFIWYTLVFAVCPETCSIPDHLTFIISIFFWLGYLNSSMNPIVYAFMTEEFKRAFLQLFKRVCPCREQPTINRKARLSLHREDLALIESFELTQRCDPPMSRKGSHKRPSVARL